MTERLQQQEARERNPRVPWGTVLLLMFVAAFYWVTTRPAAVLEGWRTDYGAALQEAASGDSPVLVAFYMKGCPACEVMDRTVLGSAKVRSVLKGFVPVRVDVDKERELANHYKVFGTPTYAVLDAEERLVSKTEGYQPVEAFVSFLERAAEMTQRNRTLKTPPPSSGF